MNILIRVLLAMNLKHMIEIDLNLKLRMDKKAVVHIHNGVLLSCKKEFI